MRPRPPLPALLAPLVVLALSALGPAASAQLGPVSSPCAPGAPTAQYPPSACSLVLDRTEVRPGEALSVSGAGFRPNSTVALAFRFPAVSLGTAQADSSGVFSTTVTIPADASPGTHTIAATGVNPDGTPRELTATVRVLGVVQTGPDERLPRTGVSASTLPAGIAGVVLVGVGALAIIAARRRRTA